MVLKEILLCYVDITVAAFELFDPRGYYRKPIQEYQDWRIENKISAKMSYNLQREGLLIKKNRYYELSPKGRKKIHNYLIEDLKISKPKKWDAKWRFVIFDIPEDKKAMREIFRRKLKRLGLESVQKSVYCYPHDCIREITFIARNLEIEPYITYLEVSDIVTDKNIFQIFKDKSLL